MPIPNLKSFEREKWKKIQITAFLATYTAPAPVGKIHTGAGPSKLGPVRSRREIARNAVCILLLVTKVFPINLIPDRKMFYTRH